MMNTMGGSDVDAGGGEDRLVRHTRDINLATEVPDISSPGTSPAEWNGDPGQARRSSSDQPADRAEMPARRAASPASRVTRESDCTFFSAAGLTRCGKDPGGARRRQSWLGREKKKDPEPQREKEIRKNKKKERTRGETMP